jgi:hypothetical protein
MVILTKAGDENDLQWRWEFCGLFTVKYNVLSVRRYPYFI